MEIRVQPLALVLRRRGIGTREFATRIGYSPDYVSGVLHLRYKPSAVFKELAAAELELASDALFLRGESWV